MRVLHAGSGGSHVPQDYFQGYKEVTLDIDERCNPDILTSIVDLSPVPDECFEAAYTSHTLEHIYPHEVRQCLWNFHRVLKPGGVFMVVVPNLDGVKPNEEVLYESESGPICGLDMYYGHHEMIKESPYMAHHCGFIPETLKAALESVGFEGVHVIADATYNLIGIAGKGQPQ